MLQVLHVMEAGEAAKEDSGIELCDAKLVPVAEAWAKRRRETGDSAFLLDAQNEDGETALFRAAERGNTPAVKLLVASGADVALRPKRADPPLVVLQAGGGLEVGAKGGGRMVSGGLGMQTIKFDDGQFDEFVVGMPSAAVKRESGGSGSTSMFEVEVSERLVGKRSRLVIGLSSDAHRGPIFRDHLGEGASAGDSVGLDVSGEDCRDWGRPVVGGEICYASNSFKAGPWWMAGPCKELSYTGDGEIYRVYTEDQWMYVPIEKVLWRQQSLRTKPMVVGVAFDGDRVRFFIDGVEQHDDLAGPAPPAPPAPGASSSKTPSMFPAISGRNCSVTLHLNASGPFKYPLQDGRRFADVAVGDLPSHAAALNGHFSSVVVMVEALARRGLLDERGGKDDSTLLCLCASSPSGEAGAAATELLEALLNAGADPKCTDAE